MLEATRILSRDGELSITAPAAGQLLVVLAGRDCGSFGSLPFREMDARVRQGNSWEICFDLRAAAGATLGASAGWAVWLRKNQSRLRRVSMLTARPFVTLSAKTVKRFSELGERARIYSGGTLVELD
jgi:hypothetical protein